MTNWKETPKELMDVADFIYSALTQATTCPQDAAEVMTVVWVKLYISGRAPEANIDQMLEGLANTIRMNVAMYDAEAQGGMQ